MNFYKTKYKNISIDFDGVIHGYSKGRQDGIPYDKPKEGAIESLIELYRMGLNIIIFTSRPESEFQMVEDYIRHYLTDIYKNIPLLVTNKKHACVAYIDDRAIHFTNWKQTMNDTVKQIDDYIKEHAIYGEMFKEDK